MKMLKTTVPMLLAATVLSGCSTFQEGNVPVCAAIGGVTGAGLGAIESSSMAGTVGLAGGVMGGLGGFTGVLPTLWCTLRRLDKDVQRAIIQNFNLAMLLVTFITYLATGQRNMVKLALSKRANRPLLLA